MRLLTILLLAWASCFSMEMPKPKKATSQWNFLSQVIETSECSIEMKSIPTGWGLEDLSAIGSVCRFYLFPKKITDYGCKVKIVQINNEDDLAQAYQSCKQKFSSKSTKALQDGFEVNLPHSWYACRTQKPFLIEMWYVIPKKKAEKKSKYQSRWGDLKKSLKLQSHGSSVFTYQNPDKSLQVTFQPGLCTEYIPSYESELKKGHFSTRAGSLFKSGYFYVFWEESSDKSHYISLLNQIIQDLSLSYPQQKRSQYPHINLQEQFALYQGQPFSIIVCGTKDKPITIAFALKEVNWSGYPEWVMQEEINRLLDQVKWIEM